MTRIDTKFAKLKKANRSAFIAYIMAGDPDYDTSLQILKGLAQAGVDIIELGIPFTDPMADGPAIQRAGQRALAQGMTLKRTLKMVQDFRQTDMTTPIVLMGYYNPIYIYGVKIFIKHALETGVDGLIVVDLPPEENAELCLPAQAAGLNFIRLATPTTDARRLPMVLQHTSGFIYYVAINGITGTGSANPKILHHEVSRIKDSTSLPICVGFGIKTADDVKKMAQIADGVIVGSAIVQRLADKKNPTEVLNFVKQLTTATHTDAT